jgi:predicted nucleotidyltransferase
MDIEKIKLEIIDRLKPLNLNKIVLFGSYAYGTPHQDSDIDLYVVTDDDFIPQNWKEKNQLYLKVSRAIRDLREYVAIDLIVHSKKMHEIFKETNSSFFKHDISRGINLI